SYCIYKLLNFFFQAEDGIRDFHVTGVQTCALPISEVAVAEHHGVGRAPLVAGEEAREDVVDVGLERRVEAVRPGLDLREDGNVRSEERRVGIECRCYGTQNQHKRINMRRSV